jgi:hypothetical protein
LGGLIPFGVEMRELFSLNGKTGTEHIAEDFVCVRFVWNNNISHLLVILHVWHDLYTKPGTQISRPHANMISRG